MGQRIQPGRSVTVAVVEAVSALENRPPDALPPLHDVIGNDLDEIFEFDDADQQTQILRLTFEYEGYYITIDKDATISIELEPKPEDPFAV